MDTSDLRRAKKVESDSPSEIGIWIAALAFVGLFAYVFIAAVFPSHSDEKAFARDNIVRVDIKAEYGINQSPRRIYEKTLEEPASVQRLAAAAHKSGLGRWSRRHCRLSHDLVTLTFTARSGDKYTARAQRCVACYDGAICGKDRSYKDDDNDDPLLQELTELGFPLVQDDARYSF